MLYGSSAVWLQNSQVAICISVIAFVYLRICTFLYVHLYLCVLCDSRNCTVGKAGSQGTIPPISSLLRIFNQRRLVVWRTNGNRFAELIRCFRFVIVCSYLCICICVFDIWSQRAKIWLCAVTGILESCSELWPNNCTSLYMHRVFRFFCME